MVANVIIVTASVQKFGFGPLDSYLGLRLGTQDFRLRTWDLGSGLSMPIPISTLYLMELDTAVHSSIGQIKCQIHL